MDFPYGLCPIPISLLPLSHTVSTDHAPRLGSKFYIINAQNSWEPGTPIATLLPHFLETSASPRYLAESTCPGWGVGASLPINRAVQKKVPDRTHPEHSLHGQTPKAKGLDPT